MDDKREKGQKFAIVDGDGEPMWQFADDEAEANHLLGLMEAQFPGNGPWSIVCTSELVAIMGVDGEPKWVVPQKFWN